MAKDLDDYRAVAKGRLERTTSDKFKIAVGDNTIRILKTPAGKTSTAVLFEFQTHSEVGPEKAWLRCGIDPVTGKGKCWICQKLIPKLEKQGKDSRASKLAPETKLVMQVASIDANDKWTGPHLYYPSSGKATELTTLLMSKRKDYADPKRGYNIGFTRTGTSKTDTRYGPIETDQDPSKVPSKIQDALKPFDELKQVPKYDEVKQKKAYYGESAEEDEEDTKSRRKSKDEDEDDYDEDVDDLDEDDDDDEDEKPKKKKKSSSKKKSRDDDDEDEEDDDEDEDEEEEPVRKKKKKKTRR